MVQGSQWYLSYDGKQIGPFDKEQAIAHAQKNPNGHVWREGFADWLPISQIDELSSSDREVPGPPPSARSTADEIDFKIMGSEMQFVEVELDPGESAVAEAGAMMYKDSSIAMETVFGDASSASQGGGFMDKLLGAGKRLLTGESLFMTVFTHNGQGKAHVAFGAPYPGNIIPVPLTSVDGCLICQKDSFLCAAKGVSIGIHLQRKILTGLFGGEGFIMQKLEGDGLVFVHAGGTVVDRELQPGEVLHVDTGCIVAMESSVQFEIQQAGNIKTALFGGEGLFFATLHGPGKIWLQSLPFSRLAGRMLQASPERGGGKGEGSILGSLGGFFDGDG
ncbi:MAG: TIGR00266 family protein [Deltaproteobacteria bacterium]|nr:TIGR00266 family protein [Deltaproteobacteria bacterium]